MPRFVNLLLLIVGLIVAATGLARLHDHSEALLLLLGGIAVGMAGMLSDNRRKVRIETREHAATQSKIDELTKRPWRSGDSLRIPASVWMVPGVLVLIALGAGCVYMDVVGTNHDWSLLSGGILLLAIGLLALGRTLGGVGHPALELNTAGIVTPLNGKIAWRDVSGIFLQTITRRTGGKTYRILFRVKNFAHAAERIHWTDRLFASMRVGATAKEVVNVWLPASKEDPEAVHALARRLWKQATGNDYDWNPMMSDRYNAAAQRLGSLTARLREPNAVEPSMANLKRVERDMAQAQGDIALMRSETKRQLARGQWILGLFVLLALLAVTTSVVLDLVEGQ